MKLHIWIIHHIISTWVDIYHLDLDKRTRDMPFCGIHSWVKALLDIHKLMAKTITLAICLTLMTYLESSVPGLIIRVHRATCEGSILHVTAKAECDDRWCVNFCIIRVRETKSHMILPCKWLSLNRIRVSQHFGKDLQFDSLYSQYILICNNEDNETNEDLHPST